MDRWVSPAASSSSASSSNMRQTPASRRRGAAANVFSPPSTSSSSSSPSSAESSSTSARTTFTSEHQSSPTSPSKPSGLRRKASRASVITNQYRKYSSSLPHISHLFPFPAKTSNPHQTSALAIVGIVNRPKPKIPVFPTEIVLILMEHMTTRELCKTRYVSKSFAAMVSVILTPRVLSRIGNLTVDMVHANTAYTALERSKLPDLHSSRQFLRDIPLTEVKEATWYATPPAEMQTICECLCILFGQAGSTQNRRSSNKASSHLDDMPEVDAPLPWSTIKKIMSRYDFKTWLMNLRTGVDFIPAAQIKKVERILMVDPQITYERVREVSMAGYRLLILVAACWQCGTIMEDLRVMRKAVQTLETKVVNAQQFASDLDRYHPRLASQFSTTSSHSISHPPEHVHYIAKAVRC